ncbi:MAG: penicillin-binding transpeptidase domain-containing protein [Anaerolineae bacterium]|nr:penicillin-binding transpeptidase domain-containing protein [Anaerolineae bacterium]
MKKQNWIYLALILAAGCSLPSSNSVAPTASGPRTLPTPETTLNAAPDPSVTARAYLDAWANWEYEQMFNMLTSISQDGIGLEFFTGRYQHVASEANLSAVEYEILQSLVEPYNAQIAYRVTLVSAIVGPITSETTMNLSRQPNEPWRVIWDDRLIMAELAGGNRLSMEYFVPARGNIYDRDGSALVTDARIYALTVLPSGIGEKEGGGLVSQIARMTGLDPTMLSARFFIENPPFFIPAGEVSEDRFNEYRAYLEGYGDALRWEAYDGRLSYAGGAAPQTVGYFGTIPADEVDEWARLGYPADARVGRMGLERWGEPYLAGKRGGALYLINPAGEIVTTLGRSEAQAAQSIYTTLEKDLQLQAQNAIRDFTGAIVVMERDTGRVLAMVSSPGFNPNAADPANFNSQFEWEDAVNDPTAPFFNRATHGQYPPGSIFKVVTLSAALESGIYTPQSELFCGHTWDRLGTPLADWTLEKGLPASGQLNLLEGLMRSCNPWFYEIGYVLYNNGFPTLVADLARGFGLSSPTGLFPLTEEAGNITDPGQQVGGAVQQAIGQGTTLITPLQAAAYVAAIGNGGTLYRPQLIEMIESPDGTISLQFEAQINGTLPISEETLQAVRTGMRMVIVNERGTAYRRFTGFSIPVAGKTGTAQTGTVNDLPHAWFIGYTFSERPNRPDIAIAVLVENAGDGSDYAAPIFRRIAEIYFFGKPQTRYWWEESIGVPRPPEPEEVGDGNGNGGQTTFP